MNRTGRSTVGSAMWSCKYCSISAFPTDPGELPDAEATVLNTTCLIPAAAAASISARPRATSRSVSGPAAPNATGGTPNTAMAPSRAGGRLAGSSKSPRANWAPAAARAAAVGASGSRTSARTGRPAARRRRVVAPPCLPVAPVTRMREPGLAGVTVVMASVLEVADTGTTGILHPLHRCPQGLRDMTPAPEQSAAIAGRADARRNREIVLRTAVRAFAEEGLELSLGRIAQRAGVGAGTVYRHFPSKEILLEAVLAEHVDTLAAAADRWAARAAPGDALFEFLLEVIEKSAGRQRVCDVLTADHGWPHALLAAAVQRFGEALDRLLRNAKLADAIRADVRADDLAT